MTLSALFSGGFFSALGWALFHFLWQGALVAGLFAALAWMLRKRAPTLRYALACGALATMVALPAATTWSLAWRARDREASGNSRAPLPVALVTPAADEPSSALFEADRLLPATFRNRVEALRPWALSIWFAGVLFLSIRFAGGLAAAQRLTRRDTRPAPPVWQEILARLASRLSIARPIRLLESAVVNVPTAIGAFRPVVLFPATVFLGLPTRGLEALLAHELAHVRRHDYLVNLLQTAAETLLFYHPAVWWISARVRAEREECCDDLAISATGDARTYARALMRLEEMRGAAPVLAVAAGGGNLWKRVLRLLTQRPGESDRPSGWLAGGLALVSMIVLGAAARFGPASALARRVIATPPPDAVVRAAALPAKQRRPPARTEEPSVSAETATPEIMEIESAENVAEAAEPGFQVEAADAAPPETPETPEPPESRTLDDEEIAAFRNHGVTAEYVRAIAALGYEKADPDDILSLKIHGVTPKDIADMNAIFGKLPLEDHVSLKIHGVTPDTVRSLSALGLGRLSADDALSMRIHGVDAAYVEKLRSAGYRQISAEDAISARIHGVSPDDAEGWRRLGYTNASLEDLVGARIHGASPEFATEVRSLGFSNLPLEDLVAFRIHGVSGDFLRQMKSLGFSAPAFTADDAVAFRVHGVTAELVRDIRGIGYPNASPDDLVGLRIHGISADDVRRANVRAGRRLPLEDVIDRHDCGKEKDDEN